MYIYLLIIILTIICLVTYNYNKSPFKYPYLKISIDISRKRNVVYEDYIIKYIENNEIYTFTEHVEKVKLWKKESQALIDKSIFSKKRNTQFLECIDDNKMFIFEFYRMQTRYKQINYVKTPYKVSQLYYSIPKSFEDINNIQNKLTQINKSSIKNDKKIPIVKPVKEFGWYWFFSGNEKNLEEDKCGKWMLFFSDQEFAKKICSNAINENICYECKCTDMEVQKLKTGVICFYQNGDDIENHKKIINFMLDNELIRKTKTGKFYNNSFKYDTQTQNKEYGDSFEGKLSLSNFIDLNSGKWIFDNKIME